MQYSPKLKAAMEEIKKILKAADIAGVVVLHHPGHSEYLVKIDPSYSCARFEGADKLRIRARLKEDFNGDKDAWLKTSTDTSNMLRLLSDLGGKISLNLFQISDMVDKAVDAEHTDGGHTSHIQQNN